MSTIISPVIFNPAEYIAPSAAVFGEFGTEPVAVTEETPFPVRDRSHHLSLVERLNREGELLSNATNQSFTTFSPNANLTALGFGQLPPPGRAFFVSHLTFSSTTPIFGRWQAGASQWAGVADQAVPRLDIGFSCGPNYAQNVPVNAFLRSSDRPLLQGFIARWLDASVSGTHHVQVGAVGWTLADAINFDAKKVILFLGDSLWNGSGPSSVRTCIPWLINKFYRDKGIDNRYILKAYSGATSTGIEHLRQGSRFDFPQIDAMFYQLGTNDGADTTASMANVTALVAWKQDHYPHAKLVILGSPPAENNTTEANIAALRAAEAAYVAGLEDPNVLFCSLADAFDRTVVGNYLGSDPAGNRVHPDDDGLTQIWDGGYSGYPGLRAWLDVNLPGI